MSNRQKVEEMQDLTGTHVVFGLLFLLGFLSLSIFFVYLLSAMMFVFSNAPNPGAIAYIPKEIFFLIPLSFLRYSQKVKEILGIFF